MKKICIFLVIIFSFFFVGCEKNTTVLKIGINKDSNRTKSETSIIIIEISKNSSNSKAIWSHEFSINTERGVILAELEVESGEYYVRAIEKKSDGATIGRYAIRDTYHRIKPEEYNSYYISVIPGGGFSADALAKQSSSTLAYNMVSK